MRAFALAAMILTTPALADDFPPGPGTSGVIAPPNGGVATGVIDYAGDVDAFTVQLPADGRAFRFTVHAACHQKTVWLYNLNFTLLRGPWVLGRPDQDILVEWVPGYTGLYYVVVKDLPLPPGYVCPIEGSNTYTVTAGESCSSGGRTVCTLGPGETKTGFLHAVGDRNWYRLDLQRPRNIMINLSGDFGGTAPILTLRDAAGGYIISTDNPAATDCFYESPACMTVNLCPGTYFFAVRDDAIVAPQPYAITLDKFGGKGIVCP